MSAVEMVEEFRQSLRRLLRLMDREMDREDVTQQQLAKLVADHRSALTLLEKVNRLSEGSPAAIVGEGPMLSPADVAEVLGVTDRTVRNMLAAGTLPSIKVEGARRISVVAVRQYIEERRAAEAAA